MPHARAFFAPIIRFLFRRTERRTPVDPKTVRRVLILRYDAIGDAIVTLPMIDALRQQCPGCQIDVVTSRGNDMIFAAEPEVRRYVYGRSFRSYLACWWHMRENRYDITFALVFHKTTLSGWLANTLGTSSMIVTFAHPERHHIYKWWFNMQVYQPRDVLAMKDMQLRLVESALGVQVPFNAFPLRLPLTQEHASSASTIVCDGAFTVVVNLSAGNPYRMWSEERNAELVRTLWHAYPDWHFRIVGFAERQSMAQRIALLFPSRVEAAPPLPFLTLAAVIQRANLLITPDTSLVHAASAVGTPVVGLYTHRSMFINEWMPYGVPHRIVVTEGRVDLETIPVSSVITAVDTLAAELSAA
jgi:ADP-heptose:LPS heptosyltransferase